MIKNAGFVAYAIEGSYDVLAIVDQTHLSTPVKDHVTGATLGWSALPFPEMPLALISLDRTDEVTMISPTNGGKTKSFVVALLYVLIASPISNVS